MARMTVQKAALREAMRLAHVVCTAYSAEAANALNRGIRLGVQHRFDFARMLRVLADAHRSASEEELCSRADRRGSRSLRRRTPRNGSR